ncbi:MAG: helix-turn-helix domain-containing protein [Acidobacteria bacterium]|nr:helix-turn-helix domain-containing protein [Acidobacteriota bacterium]
MMIPERPSLERRVLGALDGTAGNGPRIPIVLGGCGTGRTSLLLRLRDLLGRSASQYIDVERIATTPERFLKAARDASPFATNGQGVAVEGARDAFDATLAFLDTVRGPGDAPVTFLLDEFLELRTFESFPGLRTVLRDLVGALASSGNRFVLTSRYSARAHRLLRDAPAQFEIIHVAPLSAAEVRATLPAAAAARAGAFQDADDDHALDELARMVQALSDGRPRYASMIAETAASLSTRGAADPVSALTVLLAPGEQLSAACRFCYELRLHRARGYGALKAILEVLAEEESLTLTEIALRLQRTPGSTKDYLSWLEDVDLIVSRQKRYSFTDPMLRLWIRLHCRPAPPTEEDITREVHRYVIARLPHAEPALALAGAPPGDAEREKNWGIIEID